MILPSKGTLCNLGTYQFWEHLPPDCGVKRSSTLRIEYWPIWEMGLMVCFKLQHTRTIFLLLFNAGKIGAFKSLHSMRQSSSVVSNFRLAWNTQRALPKRDLAFWSTRTLAMYTISFHGFKSSLECNFALLEDWVQWTLPHLINLFFAAPN